jgi:hypothetical protein
MKKLRTFSINFYALNKSGEYGGGALWGYSVNKKGERKRVQYAVNDGADNKLHDIAYLYESPDK